MFFINFKSILVLFLLVFICLICLICLFIYLYENYNFLNNQYSKLTHRVYLLEEKNKVQVSFINSQVRRIHRLEKKVGFYEDKK